MKLAAGIVLLSAAITAVIVAGVTADWRPLVVTAICLFLIRKG